MYAFGQEIPKLVYAFWICKPVVQAAATWLLLNRCLVLYSPGLNKGKVFAIAMLILVKHYQ